MDFRQLTLRILLQVVCAIGFTAHSLAQAVDESLENENFVELEKSENPLLEVVKVKGIDEDLADDAISEVGPMLFNSKFSNAYSRKLMEKETRKKRLGVMWRARLIGESAKLETQNSETSGLDLRVQSRYHLLKSLHADVYLRGKFESGHSRDFFGDLEPNSAVMVREAAITFDPIRYFDVRLGVIDQDWMNMGMLTFRKSFPGAMANIYYNWTDNLQTSFTSQYTIPTSSTLSPRTVGKESTPEFIVHRLGLEYSDNRNYEVGVAGSLYEYKNLPSFIAFQSKRYGNSGPARGQLNDEFEFPFKGWFTQTYAKYRINRFIPYAEYSVIKNQDAPETFNDGQVITIGTGLDMDEHFVYAEYSNFFAESDVVPAYYNSWAIGHTNSEGFGVDIGVEFKKYNFRLRSYYYRANVLDRSGVINNSLGTVQDQNFFFIAVETAYDTI